jgi:hypothetical protein
MSDSGSLRAHESVASVADPGRLARCGRHSAGIADVSDRPSLVPSQRTAYGPLQVFRFRSASAGTGLVRDFTDRG